MAQRSTVLIIVAGILTGLCLLFLILVLFILFKIAPVTRLPFSFPRRFESNGERIYYTATSESGDPISADFQSMHQMGAGRLTCADCHGPNGQGGTVRMMMAGSIEVPDIRYQTLTSTEGHDQAHEEHPPYTEETLRIAITQGIDPAGELLEWPMPRWNISERDLNDLIDFLKMLK